MNVQFTEVKLNHKQANVSVVCLERLSSLLLSGGQAEQPLNFVKSLILEQQWRH